MQKRDAADVRVRQVFIAWELLRPAYNAVLLAEGLWVLRGGLSQILHNSTQILIILLFAATANVFYLAGPGTEYIATARSGRPFGHGRYLLFTVGLLFSACLVFLWAARLARHF